MEKVFKLLYNTRNVVRRNQSDPQSYTANDFHNHEVIFAYIKARDKRMARKIMIDHMQILKKLLTKGQFDPRE
jgi:DNA-binding GntR family transcriptional regulator